MAEGPFQRMLATLGGAERHRTGEVLVIGLGRFGSALANTLIARGYEVLAVDEDLQIVERHSGTLTHVVQADTTSERTLRQVGAADVNTAVVCIGTDVEASVLTTAALVDIGVENIWAKAITEQHGKILQRVGAHHVVFPEAEMGTRVAHLVTGHMLEYIAFDDDFVMSATAVPKEYVGMTLAEAGPRARFKVTVVSVKPEGGSFTYATSETVLGANDLIVVAGHRDDVDRFAGHV